MKHHRPIILNPELDAAITAVLAMNPDRPGDGKFAAARIRRRLERLEAMLLKGAPND